VPSNANLIFDIELISANDMLCFATNNQHKIEEVRAHWVRTSISSPEEVGCKEELPEEHRPWKVIHFRNAEYRL